MAWRIALCVERGIYAASTPKSERLSKYRIRCARKARRKSALAQFDQPWKNYLPSSTTTPDCW
jgi:hypothetical protein